MKFRIHDDETDDSLVIEAETIEEIREVVEREANKRGWKNPWSEQIL